MTKRSDPEATPRRATDAKRTSAGPDGGSEPPLRDAPGQIACLILSLPIAGLGLLAVFVAFVQFPNWVARPLLEALSTRLGLGIGGIGATLAGTWMAARILTGKSAPGTTWAARLLSLGVAASLGALGAALLVAAISHQAASTF